MSKTVQAIACPLGQCDIEYKVIPVAAIVGRTVRTVENTAGCDLDVRLTFDDGSFLEFGGNQFEAWLDSSAAVEVTREAWKAAGGE